MRLKPTTLTVLLALLAACSSPPLPPSVDDSKKRPVNAGAAVELQMCRSELAATGIVLTEALNVQQREAALLRRVSMTASTATASTATTSTASTPPVAGITPPAASNHIFVINFPLGSADVNLASDSLQKLLTHVRNAQLIVIRGRTDAKFDSPGQTRLAQRRSEAAYSLLLKAGSLPSNIRLSWQGAGDPHAAGGQAADRQANRRVEIELYQTKPAIEVLGVKTS
jgi:outer membrane protein OmpA-like peptidoglycan-associated protein